MRDHAARLRYLAERAAMPFAWGRHGNDCASFAAGAVIAQTGRDPLTGLRWESERGAIRILARDGGIEAIVDRRLIAIAPAMAVRGDIAGIADARFGVSLMVVEGAMLIGPGARGAIRLPRARMIRAWSIAGLADE